MTREAWCVLLALLTTSASVNAQDAEAALFSSQDAQLSDEELSVLSALERNRPRDRPTSQPIVTQDGTVRFTFGTQHPAIVCAPLQVCDVALEPGEQVHSVNLGDSVRWSVEPAISMQENVDGSEEIQHLIIKASDAGIETALVVTTDRR